MTATEAKPAAWAGLAMYGAIGAIAFAVSLDHAHQLFVDHGQTGWVGTALAVVVVLLAAGSVVEGVRRVRAQETLGPVIAAVLIGVGIEAWGNLATAAPNLSGYLIASVPTIVTLVVLWALESARSAAEKRRRAVEEQHRRERAEREAQAARVAAERRAAAEAQRAEEAARRWHAEAAEAERVALAEAQRVAEEERRLRQAEAERLRQEAVERASAAARDAASAEAELVRQRANEAAAKAEAERLRQEARQRRSQPRKTTTTPPAGARLLEVIKAALTHAQTHGALPTETQLIKTTGASRSTATRALREARQTHEQTQGLHLVPTATA